MAAYSLWGSDYFALANEESNLHIFQVVDDEVVAKGIGPTVGLDRDVAVRDWYAFVSTNSGLTAVSVAIPESPTQIGFINLAGDCFRVDVSATHAFVARDGLEGLAVVDITDPQNMSLVGTYGAGSYVKAVWVDGDRLGIFRDIAFEILDISVPESPSLLGSLTLDNGIDNCVLQGNLASGGLLVLAGEWAYQEESGLVLDLSDPSVPAPAGNISLSNSSLLNPANVVAGSEYIVTGDLFDGPDSFGQYLAAQGSSGDISAVNDEIPPSGTGLGLEAVPNPFNPKVTLRFELLAASATHLEIFDLRGRLVADLGKKYREAGSHGITWTGIDRQGRNLPSGVYLARLRTSDQTSSRKIVLAR